MTLNFAMPSKGRLADQSTQWLLSRGVRIINPAAGRGYSGKLTGALHAELLLLSASEIPGKLADGDVHLAITGMDLVRESVPQWQSRVREVALLGFGGADLVISVPKFWIDAQSLDDLDSIAAQFRRNHGRRLRIATKYTALVHDFLSRAGVADYQLVYSRGATEGSVSNNFADAIADLVSTGATLDANELKPLPGGVVLRSQAALFQSRDATVPVQCKAELNRFMDSLKVGSASIQR